MLRRKYELEGSAFEPLRAQNDFERCRVCGREIPFAGKVNRDTWPYQYQRKHHRLNKTIYCCSREHYYIGKSKDAYA